MNKRSVWAAGTLIALFFLLFAPVCGFAEPVDVRGQVVVSEEAVYLHADSGEYLLEGMDVADLDGQEVMASGEVRAEDGVMIMNVYSIDPVVSEEFGEVEEENGTAIQ